MKKREKRESDIRFVVILARGIRIYKKKIFIVNVALDSRALLSYDCTKVIRSEKKRCYSDFRLKSCFFLIQKKERSAFLVAGGTFLFFFFFYIQDQRDIVL